MSTSGDPRALRDAVRALLLTHGALDDGRRPCGAALPMPHAWALLELHRRGPLTVTELASTLGIDRTNVSRLCARMEAAGDVHRRRQATDRRTVRVELTERGVESAAAVDGTSAGLFGDVIARLPADVDPAVAVAVLDALTGALAAACEAQRDVAS